MSGASPDQSYSAKRLKSFVQRIERVQDEIKARQADVREIMSEAKSSGFDPRIIRKAIALRKLDPAERQEQESLLELYMDTIEGIADMPLGQAAVATAKVETAEKVRQKRAVKPKANPLDDDLPTAADVRGILAEPDHDPETGEVDDTPDPSEEPTRQPAMAASDDGLDIPPFLRRC